MTHDVVALTPKAPDNQTLLAGLYAGGPSLRVDSVSEGAAIQLHTSDGVPLLTVEVPILIQVPGEVSRLFGEGVRAEAPMWWTEVRATTAVKAAGQLAGSVAGRLTAVLGGTTWPPTAAHTEVVTVSSQGGEPPAPGHRPGVDILTDRAAVVFQDRPTVAATTSLTDLLQSTVASGRELQIVTPPSTHLTLPARTLLTGLPARWVVRDTEGCFYDGLTGVVLHWHDGHFTPTATTDNGARLADSFTAPAPDTKGERQLLLTIRTTHPADENLLLGGALEACWQILTGTPPAGWSTAEPVNLPWSARQLTELARTHAQKATPTWLVAVGAPDRPAITAFRITHTPAGVEEHITLAVGYPAGQTPPLGVLPELAETLATRHRLTSMLTHLRLARADLTTPPHHEPPPIPVSFTLGPDAVQSLGHTVAESAPGIRPRRLGATARPALHYPLGDGADPAAWQLLKRLNELFQRGH
ncbi:hypothetical protein SSP24_74330 [Streptomyces spinoverrucosus]|uniref:Uncharacterized protein n=1 Tax=Streptomyces spinoverrucosus TaxID=284043 RepID=A0A4Y3VU64_9ACTN|nr:DUF6177 family protein [Streptomyces spinoverrucosus]GEC09778.1 hypothetical protein SSP24_74330 [Streptomyces spinoverrucosus]GHB52299.1 hypothetical protein GCM10010397_22720 [Streptomyces spinoverrucosus]